MTISNYPYLKLLLAIIVAVAVAIMRDSLGWGLATFLGFMFVFIFVGSWIQDLIFGISIKGEAKVDNELEELLNKLETIGNLKNELPFNSRAWCNSLGLFVQLREKGGLARLQAGDNEYQPRIDAWRDDSLKWRAKKYDAGDWEKLVSPTLEVTNWLSSLGGLPEEYVDSFNRAVEVFKKEGHLKLPDVRKAGEEPLKLEEPENKVQDGIIVKTPHNIAQQRTKIDEYDQELLEDIERLKKHILEDEEIAKDFMRGGGLPEKGIEDVARKARNEGRPISIVGSNRDIVPILTFLTGVVPVYKAFPFRAWTREKIFVIPAETNVITKDDWLRFDTRPLDNDERGEYANQWKATRLLNYAPSQIPLYKWYPNTELMKFVEKMLMKYGHSKVLTKDEYRDENMTPAWEEASGKRRA